jgi:hypothetical protein
VQNSSRSAAHFTSARLERAWNRALRPQCSVLFLLPLIAACQININGVPLVVDRDRPDDSHDGAVKHDQDAEVTPSDADVEHDAASDASALTDSGPDGDAASLPPQHASCTMPNTASDLEALVVPTDARGRPSFDWWRDISCEEVTVWETCTPDLNGRSRDCEQCIRGDELAETGLCLGDYRPAFCESINNQTVGELSEKGCLFCADNRMRRHACCNQIAGFDCRSWPYPSNSELGGLCARHADCEPGLVCKTIADWPFGSCTCPEVNLAQYTECSYWTLADDS